MAFIHVRCDRNSAVLQSSFRIDGGPEIFFKWGKYVEVDPGDHIVQVSNESTVWTVRERLKQNDNLEVVLFVDSDGEVACAPEYYVNEDIDEDTIERIKESIVESKREEDENFNRNLKKVGFVFLAMVAFACWTAGPLQLLEGNTVVGAIGILVGAVITGILIALGIRKIIDKK